MKLSKEDRRFLEAAINRAEMNISDGGGPFGAVIVSDGNIVAAAGNRVVAGHDPTAHAEVLAIRLAAEQMGTHDLSGCVIYASCEPCPMCLGAIYWAGIRRIVYASDRYRASAAGFDDGKIYAELSLDNSERSIIMDRGLVNKGDRVLAKWEEYPFKIKY